MYLKNNMTRKVTSLIILISFLTSNSLYGAQTTSLRVPTHLNPNRLKNRILSIAGVVCNTSDTYSRFYEDVKKDQEKMQQKLENRLAGYHGALKEAVKNGKVDLIGKVSEAEIDELAKLVDELVQNDHVIFITEGDTTLSRMFLQALTKTPEWNKELKKNNRPQIHFIDSNDPVAIQNLINEGHLAGTEEKRSKVRLANLGTSRDKDVLNLLISELKKQYKRKLQVKMGDDRYVVAEDLYTGALMSDQEYNALSLDSDKLGLLVAGLIDKQNMYDIHKGAKASYDEWNNLDKEKATSYAAYQLAATQIRFANTGQNISVFTMFSKRLKGYSIWLAKQFNQEVGNADLPIWFSGEWATDHRHATAQSQAQSKGLGLTPELAREEDKGFIGLTFLNPHGEVDDVEAAVVHGGASGQYVGYPIQYLLDIDREAQRLSSQQADRPIVDLDFVLETPEDLGRMLHFGQIASVMAGRLAEATPGQDDVDLLNKRIKENTDNGKFAEVIEDGEIRAEQNILTFEDDHKLGGVIGGKIQEALDRGDRKLFEFLVQSMSKLTAEKSGLDGVARALKGGKELKHLDWKETKAAIDICEKMAQRFKKYKRLYVAAIGGSTSGDYLIRMLAPYLAKSGGPEIIYITDYDEGRLKIIEEDIRDNPDDIAIVEISKSGLTTEVDVNASAMIDTLITALNAKNRKDHEIKEHFLFITDPQLGDLREKVKKEGYLSIDHPEHGGRFTMFSEIGLLFYFLKGGDKEDLEKAVADWEKDTDVLYGIVENIAQYRNIFDLNKTISDGTRISAMKEIASRLSKMPGAWEGFLHTFINTVHYVAPEMQRDTELAITTNGNTAEMVSADKPFYQQIKVESKGKAGVRFYTAPVSGLGTIRDLWPRIVSNKRGYVTLHGQSVGSSAGAATEESKRRQAVWDAISEELTSQNVPMMSMRTGEMTPWNLIETMRAVYLELAVSAALYEPMVISSEGQPGVELAKNIFRAILASVNNDIEAEIKSYREGLERGNSLNSAQIDTNVNVRRAELKEKGQPIPKIPHEDIEKITDTPMDLRVSMGMEQDLAGVIEKLLKSDTEGNEGLVTLATREEIRNIPKHKVGAYLRRRIIGLLDSEENIGRLIMDGKPLEIARKGNWVVRVTSLEAPFNLITGTANGTTLEIYEKRADNGQLEQRPRASIRIQWGSSNRVIISNGMVTQDYVLLDDGRLVEVSKADDNNFLRMAIKGQFVSMGDESTSRPQGFQAFENEIVNPSLELKVRHSDSSAADLYLMLNKQGFMTGWMTWGDAFGLSQIIESAAGFAMIMTSKGLTHISDVMPTEEHFVSGERVYVYAGVKNLTQQIQIWMNFLNVREKGKPAEKAAVFEIMDVLSAIPEDAPITLKASAIVLLLRLKEGLKEYPVSVLLKGQAKEIIAKLRKRVDETLVKLAQDSVMMELKSEYLKSGIPERRANVGEYVLLGHKDALMRSDVFAGEATEALYNLEYAFASMTTWSILEEIKAGLSSNDDYSFMGESLKAATDKLQSSYLTNAKLLKKKKEITLPEITLGESVEDYWLNQVNMPGQAGLDKKTGEDVLLRARVVSGKLLETYLEPIKLPETEDNEGQIKLINELRKSEPELFYEEDGAQYIHSLEWIMNNIRERKAGTEVNLSGDVSSRLDGIFNSVFNYVLRRNVYAIISEENKEIVYGVEGKDVGGYRIAVYSDPIDGSSQVGHGGAFGSIFTIAFLKPGQMLEIGDFDPRNQVALGFDLQYGWPSTMLTTLNPENKYGEPEVVEFTLTKEHGKSIFRKELVYENLMDIEETLEWYKGGLLPDPDSSGPIHLALGGYLVDSIFEDGHKEFVTWLTAAYGYQSAYTGALLNDERRLLKAALRNKDRAGVLYTYPRTGSNKGKGRLRYPFEGIYYSLVFKALGGEVIDGYEPLLNTKIEGDQPSQIRVSYYSGSSWITKLKMAWWNHLETNRNNIGKTDEAMQEEWKKFLQGYIDSSRKLIEGIVNYSTDTDATSVTEKQVRRALLAWDSVDMKENYFPTFLGMTGKDAYSKLFLQDSIGQMVGLKDKKALGASQTQL